MCTNHKLFAFFQQYAKWLAIKSTPSLQHSIVIVFGVNDALQLASGFKTINLKKSGRTTGLAL